MKLKSDWNIYFTVFFWYTFINFWISKSCYKKIVNSNIAFIAKRTRWIKVMYLTCKNKSIDGKQKNSQNSANSCLPNNNPQELRSKTSVHIIRSKNKIIAENKKISAERNKSRSNSLHRNSSHISSKERYRRAFKIANPSGNIKKGETHSKKKERVGE